MPDWSAAAAPAIRAKRMNFIVVSGDRVDVDQVVKDEPCDDGHVVGYPPFISCGHWKNIRLWSAGEWAVE